jgi:hypothetical protein
LFFSPFLVFLPFPSSLSLSCLFVPSSLTILLSLKGRPLFFLFFLFPLYSSLFLFFSIIFFPCSLVSKTVSPFSFSLSSTFFPTIKNTPRFPLFFFSKYPSILFSFFFPPYFWFSPYIYGSKGRGPPYLV